MRVWVAMHKGEMEFPGQACGVLTDSLVTVSLYRPYLPPPSCPLGTPNEWRAFELVSVE